MIEMETGRLQLRLIQEQDFEDFREYASDVELSRLFGWPLHKDIARIRIILDRLVNGRKTYALVDKATEKLVGHLTIASPELSEQMLATLEGQQGVTLAFAVAPAYQRKGLISEALARVFEDLFERQGIDYIHCGYFEWNIPSKCLQEKFGFQPLGEHTVTRKDVTVRILDNILYKSNYEKEEDRHTSR